MSALLNHLRDVAMSCRAKRRTTLFDACARVQRDSSAAQTTCAEALMRCLDEILGHPARLLAPGTSELTFDEAWLMRMARSCALDDRDSLAFLLRSRVAREHQRLVAFLMARLVSSRSRF